MNPPGHLVSHGAAELEEAFAAHFDEVERITREGDWAAYADEFTEDAVYVEHAFGEMHGRDEIRAWAVKTMSAFPGRVMTGFPIAWKVLDPPNSRIVCEVRNLMADPGDGSALEEPNITILTYAGRGLWSRQEDVYNPLRFHALAQRWARIAAAHDNLPDDAAAYLS
jgi:hypothetical protein